MKLKCLCAFIVKFYVRYWFTTPVAVMAPFNDLIFLKSLSVTDQRPKFNELLFIAKEKFSNHLWYLSEELVCLSFFDDRIPFHIKIKMVKRMHERENDSIQCLKRVPVPKNVHSKDLSFFVSSSSMNFFKTLELPHEFLNKDPKDWETTESYQAARQHIKQLKVVNDVAERGVALITEFNSSITNDEEQKQYSNICCRLFPNFEK